MGQSCMPNKKVIRFTQQQGLWSQGLAVSDVISIWWTKLSLCAKWAASDENTSLQVNTIPLSTCIKCVKYHDHFYSKFLNEAIKFVKTNLKLS